MNNTDGKKYYLGIDPGRKGGLALIDEHRNLILAEPMPLLGKGYDYNQLQCMIERLPENSVIIIELKPGVMEKSASPTTSFGFHCGVIYGICLKYRPIIISPNSWKAEYDLKRDYQETRSNMKLRSVKTAEQIFGIRIKTTEDGIAEALLIAEYGRRNKL